MHETELAFRVRSVKRFIPLHRRSSGGTDLDDTNRVEEAMFALAMCFKGLDDKPLRGMSRTDRVPIHRFHASHSSLIQQLLERIDVGAFPRKRPATFASVLNGSANDRASATSIRTTGLDHRSRLRENLRR
jgi:hypothetical protein